ncbi:MAG: hypothetical protein HYZ45_03860 [Burkholderiales bacterium]|nr:hypothetical protein [Burkholderiales bacterium]
MTASTMALLDQDELMRLALAASGENDTGAAIGYLKEAISRPDARAIAHFLLGAEYATIKMYDRAIEEMQKALEMDASLAIVRLQLGLLWLSSGVAETAATVLAPLQELPADDPLRLFGAGLTHLMRDEFTEASSNLQAGIARNDSNPALNTDMQKIVQEIDNLRAQGKIPASEEKAKVDETESDSQHILLSAYTSTTTH